jgi:hypothetical protein
LRPLFRPSRPQDHAELIALGHKVSELRALERNATEEIYPCGDAFDAIKPEKPRVPLWQPDDPIDLPPAVADYSIGEHVAEPWWINMRHVLQEEATALRPRLAPPGCDTPPGYFTEAEMARRGEVLDAWRTWQRGLDQARQDSGLTDAEDKAAAISAEMGGVYRQMLKLEPQSLQGLHALALAILENCWSDEIPYSGEGISDMDGIAVLISTLTGVPPGAASDIHRVPESATTNGAPVFLLSAMYLQFQSRIAPKASAGSNRVGGPPTKPGGLLWF